MHPLPSAWEYAMLWSLHSHEGVCHSIDHNYVTVYLPHLISFEFLKGRDCVFTFSIQCTLWNSQITAFRSLHANVDWDIVNHL